MKKLFTICVVAFVGLMSCTQAPTIDLSVVEENTTQIKRVEPLSWWVGMKLPLQLMVQGDDISLYDVSLADGAGDVVLKKVHKADNPNFLFLDLEIKGSAEARDYHLLFTKGDEQFKLAYALGNRREGSAQRESFTTADMIYLMMPDRFVNGDPSNDGTDNTSEKPARDEFYGRHGGDIQGIINSLPYIADLGATAIWSTPLLLDDEPKESYHGYACGDYYHIDPRHGSNELYKEMVAVAKENGVKVIMDIVSNHCGISHWWMKDLPFENWIHQFEEYTESIHLFSSNMDTNASKHDLNLQESGWFVPSMPDMNLDNPYVLQYFKQWAIWWIEYADLGGFRVDTYPYNEKYPMAQWNKAILEEYPNFNIVGECWTSDHPQLAYWQTGNNNADGFDSNLPCIMDFALHDAIRNGIPQSGKHWGQGMFQVYNTLSHDFVYPDISNIMIFSANHDTDRITDVLNNDVDNCKIAMTLLATMRGIPQVFAGDELMFVSADRSQGHGGLRVDFPGGWPGDKVNLFDPAQRNATQTEIFEHTKALFNWRKGKEVIHNGKTLHFAGRDNTYAYFRYNDEKAVFVFINNSSEDKNIPWSNYAEITGGLVEGCNVLTGEAVEISGQTKIGSKDMIIVEYNRK